MEKQPQKILKIPTDPNAFILDSYYIIQKLKKEMEKILEGKEISQKYCGASQFSLIDLLKLALNYELIDGCGKHDLDELATKVGLYLYNEVLKSTNTNQK
ncbi:MAG: hypothetical protein OEL89_03240 [Candidatus Peregrinibacteria bacterium]|nr:hypothetical protein [Candidatus Peregrinibacteria bacterium]